MDNVRDLSAHRELEQARSDRELLEILEAGLSSGPGLLYSRFGSEVNRIVWATMGSDNDHDDIVQEVFCVLLGKIGQVEDPARLGAWVRSVTVNQVRATIRSRQRRRRFWGFLQGGQDEANEAGWVERSGASGLFRALGRLPADDRVALVLRHVLEYELTEVASLLECSLATAKRRLKAAEDRARELLEEGGD